MNKLRLIIMLISPLVLLTNCEKPEECVEFLPASVIGVQGPTNAVVGESVTFDVQLEVKGCGDLVRYVITQQGWGNETTVVATSRHTGCNCTTGSKVIRTTFSYTWTSAEVATIKFLNEEATTDSEADTYVTHQLRIVN